MIAFLGNRHWPEVDIPLSRAYAAARRAGKIGGGKRRVLKTGSDATIRRELVVLVAAANHARRWRRITAAEMPSIEYPAIERRAGEEGLMGEAHFFTRGQIDALIAKAGEALDKEMQRYIRMLYYTGARRRSIENLTVGQVDLARRKISLATPGKQQTTKRQPVVPIFDAILDDCKVLCEGKKPGETLFAYRNFYRQFTWLCRALKFPQPYHPHMVRHSRATHLLQAGKSPYDVAALLGDTVKTVENNYGHHAPDDLRGSLE